MDAVLVRISDRRGKPHAYEVWHRKCAEDGTVGIAASVSVCTRWPIKDGRITEKQEDVSCARCDQVLSRNDTPGVAGVYRMSSGS